MSHNLNSLKGGYIGDNGKESGNYYNGFRLQGLGSKLLKGGLYRGLERGLRI